MYNKLTCAYLFEMAENSLKLKCLQWECRLIQTQQEHLA